MCSQVPTWIVFRLRRNIYPVVLHTQLFHKVLGMAIRQCSGNAAERDICLIAGIGFICDRCVVHI